MHRVEKIKQNPITELIKSRETIQDKPFIDLTPLEFEIIQTFECKVLTRYRRRFPRR